LSTGALDAYYVGEPFAAQTIRSGQSKVLYYASEVWPGFICNLLIVKDTFIEQHPDRVETLVAGAVKSGLWAREHSDEAASVVAKYWNSDPELVRYALQEPPGRIVFDQFTPKTSEIQYLADEMLRFGLLETDEIGGLVDDRFAKRVVLNETLELKGILDPLERSDPGRQETANRSGGDVGDHRRVVLNDNPP
jgi:NitT/TauT family transport system substrate-binding protein